MGVTDRHDPNGGGGGGGQQRGLTVNITPRQDLMNVNDSLVTPIPSAGIVTEPTATPERLAPKFDEELRELRRRTQLHRENLQSYPWVTNKTSGDHYSVVNTLMRRLKHTRHHSKNESK